DRARHRRWRGGAPAPRPGGRRRLGLLPARYALHHAGLLHVHGVAAGVLPRALPAPSSCGRSRGRRRPRAAAAPLIRLDGPFEEIPMAPIQEFCAEMGALLESVPEKLLAISEPAALAPTAPGKWSRKQVLGHLIDSAANNHQRFVRLQFGDVVLPGYAQND